jgi:hypothetical protein
VRYGRPAEARIATDILEDPRREEIAQVVNVGVLDVDAGVHRFAPDAPLARGDALLGLLRVVSRGPGDPGKGGGEPGRGASCAAEIAGAPRPSSDLLCAAAARCGLIPAPADCLPRGPVAGREALELIRLGLDLLR